MSDDHTFGPQTPAANWDHNASKRALDELFTHARQYRLSYEFRRLLEFTRKFRFYSPFNAMLIHVQRPGATFVAPASRWRDQYWRRLKPGANPMVILQPKGPVLFVFDVSDTEPIDPNNLVPVDVDRPFDVRSGKIRNHLNLTTSNAARDGVDVNDRQAGAQSAGLVRWAQESRFVKFATRIRPSEEYATVPVRFEVFLNALHSVETKYATLVHELAHLYCGHLGTVNPRHWPNRAGLDAVVAEFEAESVCFLVCSRLGLDNPSEQIPRRLFQPRARNAEHQPGSGIGLRWPDRADGCQQDEIADSE